LADNKFKPSDATIVNEIQVLLAEKRTMLSFMRTGIAVFALPLSVLSILIATSKYYTVVQVMPLLIPVLIICIGLILLGSYLVIRSIRKLRHYDRHINAIKRKYNWVADLLE
jgi:uncharacterized membrane protein YidH (DUF202 family)